MSDELPAPEEIPVELQERRQWLYWNSSNDTPRKPLPSPTSRSGASWSDPDQWFTFEEAVANAEEEPTAGIGFVTAADNDDHPDGRYGVIDLDGVVAEEGGLKDWVPSLQPFFDRDAYMEHSPSGEGIHIPVADIEVPEWWADEHFSDDEHEGIEVLTNKFSTFTGDRIRRSGYHAVEYDEWLDEWLREAYTVLYGEQPDTSGSNEPEVGNEPRGNVSTKFDGEGFDAETVEDALSYIDPDEHYPTWRNIGFGLRSEFSRSRALSMFKSWSRSGSKWDAEAEDRAERIINDASASGGCTLGTVIYHAKQGGWSPPESSTWRDREFAETVEAKTEDTGELSGADVWEIWAEERKNGRLDETSTLPDIALEHIAREEELYNFEELPEDAEELPPKAHNRALWWVEERWAEEHLGEDEDATARDYKPRTASVLTWEDVRYVYSESKQHGRKAARDLLSDRHHFMTVAGTDTLQVYDTETGVYTDQTGEIRGVIYDELGEHWTTHELNEILAGLRQQSVIQPRHLDAGGRDEPLICVGNGVLDVFERELHDHSPEYQFVNRIPIDYNEDAETETYREFVGGLVDRDDRRKTLFEMVGHALLPDANDRYKKFLILTGDADNGKSMFYDAVSSLLNGPEGKENNTAAVKLAKLAQNRFSLNSMYGSLANIAGEIDGKMIRNTANLKDITGGDEVEIEPKGSDSFFDTMGTTLMFAANDPPILGERDKKAIATRLVPVELPYTFTDDPSGEYEKERVPEDELRGDLEDTEALSGFLTLALDGLERLEENDGDVSLKESPEERLELYEREADPMREFGTVALENHPENYIVKADIVTLYKQFASQQDYEVGSSVEKVLHHALRGIPDLNYTDSQPRSPDYSDTSLPLQGWDTRKRVINRVTLTEEGLELAEAAGLLEEETDDAEAPEYLEAGAVDLSADVSDRETLPPVRGTVAAVWENRFGQAVTELMDQDGSVDIQIVGFDADQVPLTPGVEYELSGLRARNPAGEEPYVEFRPTTTTNRLEEPGEIDSHGQDPDDDLDDNSEEIAGPPGEASAIEGMAAEAQEEAATDGGEEDTDTDEEADDPVDEGDTADTNEYEGVTGKVREHLRVHVEEGEQVTAPSIAGELAGSDTPGTVKDALNKLATAGLLEKTGGGMYKLL